MGYKFNPFTGSLDRAGSGGGGGTVDSLLRGKYVRTTRFEVVNSGTTGTVTLPTGSTVILDDFGGTVDAVVSQVSGGKPLITSARDASDQVIATTFDSSGNWVLSGTPYSYPVAILYRVRQEFEDFDSTASNIWGNTTTDYIDAYTAETSPVFTYDGNGVLTRIDYEETTYKEFFYDGNGRLDTIDIHRVGLSVIIRKTFNYTGDVLDSITQTIV